MLAAKETAMTRPVVNFAIQGKDPTRLREFYTHLFGWKMNADNPMGVAFIEAGIGGPPEGVGGVIVPGEEARVIIYVQVLSLVDTLSKAESMGGRRVMEPFDVPNGPTIAQMADPEGNVIGLVKQ